MNDQFDPYSGGGLATLDAVDLLPESDFGVPVDQGVNDLPSVLPTIGYANTQGVNYQAGSPAIAYQAGINNSYANIVSSILGNGKYIGTSQQFTGPTTAGGYSTFPGTLQTQVAPSGSIQMPQINLSSLMPWLILIGGVWLVGTLVKKV